MENALSSCENKVTDICSGRNFSNLGYADDVVLLRENSSKLQVSLDRFNIV